ncbi:MAG TPA: competence/damage-inducible protein A [Myxococcaceae bacterium]|nr:competence/damage-inducible protein A [Myxococcaceae bacterium]
MARVTAAAVVIGNEVLSAKVEEQNGAWLIKRLHEVGVTLRSLAVVPDEVDAIVEAVDRARRVAEMVITSGGIGPTHDDVTVRAVAMALGRNVVRRPEIEAGIRAHFGAAAVPAEALRLAEVPAGTELLENPGSRYPIFYCERVYILPGVPALFRKQMEVVLGRLQGEPLKMRELLLKVGESEIARALDEVALAMPDVAIGSYPQFDASATYRVKITLEHESECRVDEATERLKQLLPAASY